MSIFRRNHKGKLSKRSKSKTGSSAAFDALVEEFRKGSSKAAKALSNMDDKRAIPHLKRHLCDVNGEIRLKCTNSLNRLGDPNWQTHIQGDKDDFIRIVNSRNEQFIRVLIDTILKDMGQHEHLIQALSKLNDPFWENLIKGDGKDSARLGGSGAPRAIKLLIRFINESDLYIDSDFCTDQYFLLDRINEKNMATEALGEVNQKTAVEVLIEALKDTNNNAWSRFFTVRALDRTGDPRAVDALIKSFKTLSVRSIFSDGSRSVRWDSEIETIEALGKIGDKRAIPAMIKLLRTEQEEIKNELAEKSQRLIMTTETGLINTPAVTALILIPSSMQTLALVLKYHPN